MIEGYVYVSLHLYLVVRFVEYFQFQLIMILLPEALLFIHRQMGIILFVLNIYEYLITFEYRIRSINCINCLIIQIT